MSVIRPMLLDGYLVKERIVDRSALESILAKSDASGGARAADLFSFVCVEVWARNAPRLRSNSCIAEVTAAAIGSSA